MIVRGLDDALAAADAHHDAALELWSEKNGAFFMGALVFRELILEARETSERPNLIGVLHCGDDAGAALNAIRHHVDAISVDVSPETAEKLKDIAAQAGVAWREGHPDDG